VSEAKTIHRGTIVHLRLERARLPGGPEIELEVVRHSGAAAVVALDERGHVTLIRQFRHAAGGTIWEVPAGRLDAGEAPEACARRELEEEVGLRAAEVEPLGTILTTPGFCDERIHLFLARRLSTVETRRELDEAIEEVVVMPLAEAVSMAIDGRIADAKTVIALFLARERAQAGGRSRRRRR
jgi:ADP-ribose pyrophosphatase